MNAAFLKPSHPVPMSGLSAISLSEAMFKVRDAGSPEAVADSLAILAFYLKSGTLAVRPALMESSEPNSFQLVLELAPATADA